MIKKKNYFLLIIIGLSLANVVYGSIVSLASDYETELHILLEKFAKQKRLTDEELIKVIPKTQLEFNQYYSLSFPGKGKKWNKIYDNIEIYLGKKASVSQPVFRAYLGLALFVDGEYAEGYFDGLDFLIGKHTNYFCKIFNSLSAKEKKVLEDLHSQYCKKH